MKYSIFNLTLVRRRLDFFDPTTPFKTKPDLKIPMSNRPIHNKEIWYLSIITRDNLICFLDLFLVTIAY